MNMSFNSPKANRGNNNGQNQKRSNGFSSPALGGSSNNDDLKNPEDAESRLARFTALKEKRVLERQDAIDRGLIPDPNVPRKLKDAITFVGTCQDMCPEYERHEREYQSNLEKYEKFENSESINHARAVKVFTRPAAGLEQPLPSDVRPPHVLLRTLDYLIKEIVAKTDLSESHAFVRDRTRSIRQDFTYQNNRGTEAVKAHEIIARYHILCIHQLCESKTFSAQQEMEQLQKVLTSLQEYYDDLRTEGIVCENEAEFRAYHILSHLRDPDMIRQAQLLPNHIFYNSYIQVAAEVHALTRRSNDIRRRGKVQSEASPNFFSRFFKMIAGRATTYLMACLLEANFVEIRTGALKAMNKAYLGQHGGIAVQDLINILGFDDMEECVLNCEAHDLAVSMQGEPTVVFGRKDPTRKRIFKETALGLKQHRNERIVEVKRQQYSIEEIVYGKTPRPHETQVVDSDLVQPVAIRGYSAQRAQGYAGPNSRLITPSFSSTTATSGLTTTSRLPATKPPGGGFDFAAAAAARGLGVGTAAATAGLGGLSSSRSGHTGVGSNFSADVVKSVFAPIGSIVRSTSPNSSSVVSSALNPAAPAFQPSSKSPGPDLGPSAGAGDFSFAGKTLSTGLLAGKSSTGSFAGGSTPILSRESGPSFSLSTTKQTSPLQPSLFSQGAQSNPNPFALNLTSATTAATSTSVLNFQSSQAPSNLPSVNQPPPRLIEPPKSDATKIVTKRGKIYPRSVVESVLNEILTQETEKLVRSTASQVTQQLVVERSRQRALARQQMIRDETHRILDKILAQMIEETLSDTLADLYRERKVQQKAVDRWKTYTAQCRKRAEELRRKQEYFLKNVRAMGSRAGLLRDESEERKPNAATKMRQSQAKSAGGSSGSNGVKAMVTTVVNKRKRLLSIGQEGMSPDLVLVTGFKKVMAPKREKWAPLPVLDIVKKHYEASHSLESLSGPGSGNIPSSTLPLNLTGVSDRNGSNKTSKRTKSWRLFVDTPNFKQTSSKWLFSKLGIDMGRQTKSQQRSGSLIAIHSAPSQSSQQDVDVIVHGYEDSSVMNLLGLSKETILQTGAFIFEFSKIPFQDEVHVSQQTIQQYWVGERDRLVRFLACFPRVQQPIVFIMWSNDTEIWERISPHMVEYLELDSMLARQSESGECIGGPLLGYRFLNLDMSTIKLDPYIIGLLEWLATETRDRDEEADRAEEEREERMKRGLEMELNEKSKEDSARAWEEKMRLDALEWDLEVEAILVQDRDHVGLGRKRLAPESNSTLRRDMKRSRILQGNKVSNTMANGQQQPQAGEENPNLFIVHPVKNNNNNQKKSSSMVLTPPTTPSRQLGQNLNGNGTASAQVATAFKFNPNLSLLASTSSTVPTSAFTFSNGTPMPANGATVKASSGMTASTKTIGLTAFSFQPLSSSTSSSLFSLSSLTSKSSGSTPSPLTPTSATAGGHATSATTKTDRLARLRNLISQEKKSKLQSPPSSLSTS
ncbi:hypothetical protein BGZ83_008109 [Gryganskiella cystojenkinii]|nr:hypothetical protein BGZ83_008109 [Gryganskiella cystojenkinii]